MMPNTLARDTMSSTRGSTSPGNVDSEESGKKGARGGKRSVTHLSKAQLARKRANDREAQRNIRQRTKEHIENLERKVKELEEGGRAGSIERVLQRNRELEEEVEKLRSQITLQQHSPFVPAARSPSGVPDEELLMSQKSTLEWIPEPASLPWPQAPLPSHVPSAAQVETPGSNSPYTHNSPVYTTINSNAYVNDETEASERLYSPAPSAIPIWDDPMVFGPEQAQPSRSLSKPGQAWAPFHPAFSQPSRFADLQHSGFSDVINNPSYNNTTCWQSQPSIYAWQISTKLKAPVTHVDQLMFSVIHSQRHLAITSDLAGEDLIGQDFPPVHLLFNQPGPAKPPSTLTEVMARYSQVLSKRGFALIPEKLASFMCMYRFVQWQISPNYTTFQQLHDWQAPRPAQLLTAHPAWMDLPPWGKFREKVIENQDRYDNVEFQNDYASNLSVNFPYDPMKALVFEDGQIKISRILERHLSDIANMSMKKPFALKYPEFRDVCRFDEV